MTPLVGLALYAFHKLLVGGAALLVPAKSRVEWLREWRAEMWHVRRSCTSAGEMTAFCLGAFKDAWWLRKYVRSERARTVSLHGSAAQCLLGLAAVLAASCVLAYLLPEVRSAANPLWSPGRTGLILIQQASDGKGKQTAIPFAQYRVWSGSRHHYFDGFAFYRIGQENLLDGQRLKGGWKIAYATPNLFAVLGIPVRLMNGSGDSGDGMPGAIVSDALWRRAFGADPEIAGKVLHLGGREARIVGVAASRAWKLPGRVDAWLLEPDAAMPAHASGNVVAHLTRAGRDEMWAGRVHITAYGRDNSELDLNGISISDETVTPWDLFRFALFLSLLSLPAITTVSMGEYSPSSHKPPWPRRIVRWLYLGAKIALLLPIVYYASLDLAYWRSFGSTNAADYIQLVSAFAICLAGMRWALLDQRQRCPVCLKRVAHPAQVGLASRTFLAWNGTELMCTGGHTLLHVPGLPTSWFSTEQWLYLDASWEFLFAGSDVG
jgi:hypothetical protein